MEPISMMLMMGAGLIAQGLGAAKTNSAQGDFNKSQVQNIQLQQQVEEQRRVAMELDARRKSMENLRQVQKARSLALNTATGQGAQYGSGLQGGYGQIEGAGNWNATGIAQNLGVGEQIFDLNAQISQTKITMANAQRNIQTGQGISQFGSSLTSGAGPFGKLTSGFNSGGSSTSYGSGGLGDQGPTLGMAGKGGLFG